VSVISKISNFQFSTKFSTSFVFILFENLNNFIILYIFNWNKQKIPELKAANVRMKNPNYVEQLLSNLINSGKQRLQVISDFDRTISLVSFEGKDCPTSNGVLESSQFVTAELRDKVYIFVFKLP